jgi:predicted transcriptional regulator
MSVIIASALPSNPLDALRELAQGEAELDRLRRASMTAARAAGATWEQIGEALGMTRQSAWEYFSRDARSALARNVAKNEELTEEEAMDAAVAEVRAVRRARR